MFWRKKNELEKRLDCEDRGTVPWQHKFCSTTVHLVILEKNEARRFACPKCLMLTKDSLEDKKPDPEEEWLKKNLNGGSK